MTARTTDELLEQFERLLPGYYETAEPLLAGIAAALEVAEEAVDTLRPRATIGGAQGPFLTLQAHGHGILRATNESDASLRKRLRRVEDMLTRPAIIAAVNSIIAPDECTMVEWWEEPYLDDETESGLWLDNPSALLSGGPQSFLIVVPSQGTGFDFGSFLDDEAHNTGMWLDVGFIGEGTEAPEYAAIINEVERIRAAGVFWRLVLDEGA